MSNTILIIDDEPAIAAGLAFRVTNLGMTPLEARDGEAGLQLAKAHRPVLIVLDLNMPRMDGHATLRELRQAPETATIPVLMVSGTENAETQVLAAGANAFLPKSLLPERFEQTVKDLLSGS